MRPPGRTVCVGVALEVEVDVLEIVVDEEGEEEVNDVLEIVADDAVNVADGSAEDLDEISEEEEEEVVEMSDEVTDEEVVVTVIHEEVLLEVVEVEPMVDEVKILVVLGGSPAHNALPLR